MPGPAFVMIVGPGEALIALDTLRLARRLFPDAPIYVRDDATTDGTGRSLREWAADDAHAHASSNTRQRGYHGICTSVFHLLAAVCEDSDAAGASFVVKLDPDAVVASARLTAVVTEVFETRGPGLLGAVHTGPAGEPRGHRRAARNIWLDLLPIGPSKTGGRLRITRPFWADAHRDARRHGYVSGSGVQAGALAISTETLRVLHDRGFLTAVPEDYRAMTYEEDTILAMGVASLGHGLHELADTSAQWWVQYRPPVPLTAAQVQAGEHLLIHPLKDSADGWRVRSAVAGRLGLEHRRPA